MPKLTATTRSRTTSAESDEQLMSRYRDTDDRQAIHVLVHRYERELFSYLVRYLGNYQLAEEAFQTTFLRLHQKRHMYETGKRLKPWLYRMATNVAIDLLRRRRARPAVSLDRPNVDDKTGTAALSQLLESDEPGPGVQLEKKEWREWAQQAVDDLSEVYRTPVLLVYFQGLTYREAAEALSIPLGTVKSRLHTAILKLNEAWRRGHPGTGA